MPGAKPKPPAVRFARHVNLDGPIVRPELGPCHLWTGGRTSPNDVEAYGVFGWEGSRVIRAHRAAWLIHKGPIPAGQSVLHRCDTPLCVNPNHLFLGTQLDNMRDRSEKGRWAGGRPSVMTEEQRAQAVRRSKAGEPTQRIATTLGVSRGAVMNAIRESRGAESHV